MSREVELFFKSMMGDSRIVQGWLGGNYDDLSLHATKEDAERGLKNLGYTLDELFEDFKENKVRITIRNIKQKVDIIKINT